MGNFLVTAAIVNNHNNICSKRARATTGVKNSSKYYELAPRETDYSHTFPTFLHQLLLKEVIQVCISVEGDNASRLLPFTIIFNVYITLYAHPELLTSPFHHLLCKKMSKLKNSVSHFEVFCTKMLGLCF